MSAPIKTKFRLLFKPTDQKRGNELSNHKQFTRVQKDLAFMDQVNIQLDNGNEAVKDALDKLRVLVELTK